MLKLCCVKNCDVWCVFILIDYFIFVFKIIVNYLIMLFK